MQGTLLRHKLRVVLAAGAVLGVFFLFSQVSTMLAAFNQEVFIQGMVGQYQKNTLPATVENLVSLGLTKLNPDGSATNSAAKSWKVEEEGKLYTFYLRDDLTWHDGSPFTADDLSFLFEGIDTKIVSPHAIQFRLKNSYAPFPTILAKPLLKGENRLLGLGTYKISQIDTTGSYISSIALTRAKPHQAKNEPDKDYKLIFRFYPSSNELITAYKLGELKALYGYFDPTELLAWANLVYKKKISYGSYIAVLFNTRQTANNPLAEKTVRQALTYAIPRDMMLGEEALGPIAPISWSFNPKVKRYVYDVNVAKDLLGRKEAGQTTAITLTTTPVYKDLAEVIVASWKKIGFNALVIMKNEMDANFQAALIRQQIPPDPDQYALWHSLQKGTNLTGYSTPRNDKLLEDGRELLDQGERNKKYADFQKFLVEDAPAAFLYYPYEGLLLHKKFDTPFFRSINGFE